MIKKSKQYTEIFDNFQVFYSTLYSCATLSNDFSNAYEKDAEKIVNFVCKTYGLSNETITQFCNTIFDTLKPVATLSDATAVKKNEGEIDNSEEFTLLCIKAEIIEDLSFISEKMYLGPYQDIDCLNYQYLKPYQANMRFSKINRVASCGLVIAARQAAIMQILGIGCKQDLELARMRLISCTYWGDIFSAYLLARLYEITGETEKHDLYLNLAKLCDKYLYTGCTVLPGDAIKEYGTEACNEYALISSILQDVIYANKLFNIDFSFIEAITSEKLDYFKKMEYINQYDRKEWKELTNPSFSTEKKIGFR